MGSISNSTITELITERSLLRRQVVVKETVACVTIAERPVCFPAKMEVKFTPYAHTHTHTHTHTLSHTHTHTPHQPGESATHTRRHNTRSTDQEAYIHTHPHPHTHPITQ